MSTETTKLLEVRRIRLICCFYRAAAPNYSCWFQARRGEEEG